jgi:hypothetical protein
MSMALAFGRQEDGPPMEDIMSTKLDPDIAHSTAKTDPQAPLDAEIGADRVGRSPATDPQLATVDIVAGGKVAVTHPGMPRIFRLFLALTGVKV